MAQPTQPNQAKKAMSGISAQRSPLRRPPLAIPAAADYLGISIRHTRRLISERKVTSYRVGGRVLLDPNDLDQLLIDNRREAIR